tara:strand:+ start:1600 stop:2946 length:1347 start_codon:yes stop_codon:yes gene_type:complete
MRIYTEVVFEYDEKSKQMVEVSSKSYDHKGDIDLCVGKQHPAAWAWAQPQHLAPQITPGSHPIAGYQGLDIGAEGKWAVPWAEQYGFGGGPEAFETELGRRPSSFGEIAQWNRDLTSESPTWYQDWYTPYRETMVDAPIRNILGMTPEQGQASATDISSAIAAGGQSQFVPLSEAGIDPLLLEEAGIDPTQATGVTGTAGFTEPLITRGVKSQLDLLRGGHELAKGAYQSALEDLGAEKDIALTTKEDALKDIKLERIRTQGETLDAQEAAKARQATSGMAYSAPASKEFEDVAAEGIQQKQDFKAQEKDVATGYSEAISKIEGLEDAEDRGWDEKLIGYAGDLTNIFRQAGEEAIGAANLASNIETSHQQYGPATIPGTGHWRRDIYNTPGSTGYVSAGAERPWMEQNLWAPQMLRGIGGQVKGQAEDLIDAVSRIYGTPQTVNQEG